MLDVRVKCGADAASDHHLVVSKLQLKLKKCEVAISARTKFNVQLLQDKVFADAFQITLSNRYQVLKDMHEEEEEDDICDNMESYWNTSNRYGLKLAKKSFGKKKRQHKPWISAESLKKIEERKLKKDLVNGSRTRAAKTRAQQQYSQAHKEVRKTGQAQIYRGSSETGTRSSDAGKHEGAL